VSVAAIWACCKPAGRPSWSPGYVGSWEGLDGSPAALLRLSCGRAQGIELGGLSQKNMTDFFVGVSNSPAARISPIG